MPSSSPFRPSTAELHVERHAVVDGRITITVVGRRAEVPSSACGTMASRVHSRYPRTVADLPWQGTRVRRAVTVRRFFRDAPTCSRRIFAERLSDTAAGYARRTCRAAALVEAPTTDAPLTAEERAYRTALETACPALADTRGLGDRSVRTLHARNPSDLGPWVVTAAATNDLRRFDAGIQRDRDAVVAALCFRWSNGQVEGQGHRIELVKRSMFGRASFPLLCSSAAKPAREAATRCRQTLLPASSSNAASPAATRASACRCRSRGSASGRPSWS